MLGTTLRPRKGIWNLYDKRHKQKKGNHYAALRCAYAPGCWAVGSSASGLLPIPRRKHRSWVLDLPVENITPLSEGGAITVALPPFPPLGFKHTAQLHAPAGVPALYTYSAHFVSRLWLALVSARNLRRGPFPVGPLPADESPTADCAILGEGPHSRKIKIKTSTRRRPRARRSQITRRRQRGKKKPKYKKKTKRQEKARGKEATRSKKKPKCKKKNEGQEEVQVKDDG